MKNFIGKTLGLLVYMIGLFLFLSPIGMMGFVTGERGFFLAGTVPLACYMALITVRSKKFWEKVWYNIVFWIGLTVNLIIAFGYVGPKYAPKTIEFFKANPKIVEEAFIRVILIYIVSLFLFIAVYHVGRQSKINDKATT